MAEIKFSTLNQAPKNPFILNGIDFSFDSTRVIPGGRNVEVFDVKGTRVAQAYIDDNVEQIICDIEDENVDGVFTLNYFEFEDKHEDLAKHLANMLFN